MTQPPLPNWVYDLVNAVATYEDTHGHPDDYGHPCLGSALEAVPTEVRGQATAIRQYVACHQREVREAHTRLSLNDVLAAVDAPDAGPA